MPSFVYLAHLFKSCQCILTILLWKRIWFLIWTNKFFSTRDVSIWVKNSRVGWKTPNKSRDALMFVPSLLEMIPGVIGNIFIRITDGLWLKLLFPLGKGHDPLLKGMALHLNKQEYPSPLKHTLCQVCYPCNAYGSIWGKFRIFP